MQRHMASTSLQVIPPSNNAETPGKTLAMRRNFRSNNGGAFHIAMVRQSP